MRSDLLRVAILPFALAGGYLLVQGCGNDKPTGPAGGAVTGADDTHCVAPDGGLIAQSTDQAACQERPPDAAPGAPDAAEQTGGDFGETLYNQSGNDDDCKYHYAWTATPIYESYDIHFTLTLTNLKDGTPAPGAKPYIEATINDLHSAPPTDPRSNETSPGVYDIGPIQFDVPGKWLVRFHVFGTCLDYAENSPHGHAAFFVNVP
jgi:hypothetical protein